MAAEMSPTPASSAPARPLTRRASQRQAVQAIRRPPSRTLRRHESNPGPSANSQSQSQPQHAAMHDSSDDEMPVPMKLSALTKALLDDGAPGKPVAGPRPASPPRTRRRSALSSSTSGPQEESRRQLRSGSSQPYRNDTRSSHGASPARSRENSPVRKRVVRLSSTPKTLNQMKRRSTSTSRPSLQRKPSNSARPPSRDRSSTSEVNNNAPSNDVNTPAQQPRVVRITSGSSAIRLSATSSASSSAKSGSASASHIEPEAPEEPGTAARHSGHLNSVSRPAGVGRLDGDPALQSSMRVKRLGKIPGSFLSGPARRGRRRQSEEEAEANGEMYNLPESQDPESQPAEASMAEEPPAAYNKYADFASGSPVSSKDLQRRRGSVADMRISSARPSPLQHTQAPSPKIPNYQQLKLPSSNDQENEIPININQAKPLPISAKPPSKPPRPLSTDIRPTVSPERKPLSSINQNTPHRPAPPPPKMSVVDVATASAGAVTTQVKQRRNIIKVNGKCYSRLDVVGRGGSAKVYRVTAENGKMWAVKRVSLEHADENTIKGFKCEIDLLTTLSKVERVINLLDYEMNDEKKILTLVMELGEVDFNQFLRTRQPPDTGRFDPVFVRYYWKEMLECLLGVHDNDVVHSDLKPQNFVLVQGRLKLIDFGIANAIQTNETVHVHRETQIGTPNYMSPESLMDYNALRGVRVPGQPKLMKLGKASDVWSLGCILYQMVYGLAPFAHIANQMARCQAIINWDYAIDFPGRGMGGVPVPPSLLRTMKRCLNRDPHLRPTCEELLHLTDPFLYPVELRESALPMDEEFLARVIQHVVTRCRERMPTDAEVKSVWPAAYWASVKKSVDASRM